MVLEGYLSRFLVERFGRYVKGLDAENLRLSAWKGEILLKGLQLVPEALSEGLDIPVEVKWGHVGLFQLSVPWNKLGSKPVCATLEDVYILVTPLDTWSMDDMERQRRARYQKSRGVEWRLRKHLERKASLAEGVSKDEGGGKGRWGRLLAKILDNVQITVKNIHIRYEDELSLDDGTGTVPRPLSAGITLRQLVVQTVDEQWTPTYVQGAGGGKAGESGGRFVYKLVSVDSLAVYCDEELSRPSRPPGHPAASSSAAVAATGSDAAEVPPRSGSALPPSSLSPSLPQPGNDEEHGGEVPPTSGGGSGAAGRDRSFLASGLTGEDLESMFRTSLAGGEDRHSYVVIPASPDFRLRVQREGGGDGGGVGGSSKYKIQAFFNEVGLVLNNSQIANINKMRSTLRDLERWEALYRHRPKHKIKDGPKAWWVYLVKCVSRPGKAEKRAKLGWPDVARLLSLRKLYVHLYTARARHQATPEEYQQFTRLDEQLTANEIVAFRVKAIAELEEQEEQEASLLSSSSSANLAVAAAGEPAVPRQTWGQWLLRRDPVPAAAATGGGGGGDGDGATIAEETGPAAGGATQREDAAAQAEFLRAFSSPGGDAEGDNDGGDEQKNRVLFDVEASLNEGALTLVNAGQPCLRIIFDLKADLQKQKTDWRLELGLGALQAFGLAGQGARATTLLTRRTWRPPKADGGGDAGMIQIGDFQVWKSGGIIVEYQGEDPDNAATNKGGGRSSSSSTPAGPARKAIASPLVSPRAVSSSGGDGGGVSADQADSAGRWGGGGSGAVVTVKVVFAPHQLMHNRACVDQVTSMFATRDMRLLASAAQSKISRLKRATRSSFLHALGSSKRVEVTADIHAPLVVLPEDLEDRSRSSLLVLDLGHIAFRRDDALRRDAVETPPGDSPLASPPVFDVDVPSSSVEGVSAPGLLTADPLVANVPEDIAQDDWLLDVTGVQVVVADASSFLGPASSDNGPSANKAALSNDTAIVEEVDLNVKVRTATDLSTNGLIGVRVEANLPRLSCNVHSSAYLLLTRLLKNELERPTTAAGADRFPPESPLVSSSREEERMTRVPQTGTRGAVASRLFPASATPSLSPGSPGGTQRPRLIKAVLASELEPVTEVPGEGPLEDSDDGVGGAGVGRAGVFSLTPRRNSLSRGHHRRRSSSGSGCIHSPMPVEDSGCGGGQGVEGSERVVGDAGDGGDRVEEGYLEQPQTPAAGLVLEVRVSAPVICVSLVHDDNSTSTSGGNHASGNGAPERSATTSSPARHIVRGGPESENRVGRPPPPKGGAGHAAVSGGGEEGESGLPGVRLAAPPPVGASETVAEGALVLLEICGLGVDYRDAVGGDGHGSGGRAVVDADATKQEDRNPAVEPPSKGDPPGADADGNGDSPCKFCLSVSSFRVKDMHQRLTGDAGFSYLLSSQDPSSSAPLPLLLPEEEALRITYHTLGEKRTGGDRSGSRTVVVLGGVWGNWNPETVGALSVFTYGMYGSSGGGGTAPEIGDGGGGGGRPNAEQGKVDERSGRGVPSPRSEDLPSSASGRSIPEQAGVQAETQAERTGAAEPVSAEKGRRGGAIIVKVKRVSLWLNKEVHGRRLLLLEARESSAEIFKCHHSEGSVSNYSIALGFASLTDLGTKHSRWRSLVCPSLDSTLPPQEVRLDIVQDSRQGVEFPISVNLVLQSCTVNYLNQTWLETLDYLMNGVLGDGPWCPWLLIPQPEDEHSVDERVLPPPPPALNKKSLRIKAFDAEVRLPAGHAGASWVTFDAKTLTATNSYGTRRMGDVPSAKPETCQVWSINLDGLGIRSSRCYRPSPAAAVAPSPSLGSTVVPPRAGSKLLREDGVSLGEVTVEAWWPMVPRVGGAESDGVTSNYVVVGRAPGLDLGLHEDDFSVLWQVLAENICGPVPEVVDSLFASSGLAVGPWSAKVDDGEHGSSTNEATDLVNTAWEGKPDKADNARGEHTSAAVSRTGRRRRQLAVFPYEHPSDIATTFDVTFHLPDVALVAHACRDTVPDSRVFGESHAAPNAADVHGGVQTEAGGVVEVGKVRSALLTWRMLRFSDFRSSNEVVMAEPLLTESTRGEELSANDGGNRKLLSPGQIVPLSLCASAPLVGAQVPGATGDIGAGAATAATSDDTGNNITVRTDGQRGRATSDKVGDGVAPPQEGDSDTASPPGSGAPSPGARSGACFRWKKRSWPDGGRTNSLAVSGASVLLSKVGWGRWRVWAAAATGSGDDDNGGLSPKDESAKQKRQQVVAGEETTGTGTPGWTSFGEREAPPIDATASAGKVSNSATQGSNLEPANVAVGIARADPLAASDTGLIAELAFAFDVNLSETCLILEPWNYDSGCDRSGVCGMGGDNGWEGGDGAAVVVRVDMSMRMTSAFFLDGHWAAKLAASGTEAFQPTVPFPIPGDTGRRDDDSDRTTLLSCRLAKVEAFSRPFRGGLYEHEDPSRVHRSHRPAREENAARSPTTSMPSVANRPQGREGRGVNRAAPFDTTGDNDNTQAQFGEFDYSRTSGGALESPRRELPDSASFDLSILCVVEPSSFASGPVGHPNLSDERGTNVRHAKATTAGWRTVIEPAAGTVSYAFSPPRQRLPPPSTTPSALSPSKDASATAATTAVDELPGGVYGRRRVSVEGLSVVRAVVRPSDVQVVARALSLTAASPSVGGSVRSGPEHEEATPSPPATTPQRRFPGIADLSVRASGAGLTVRLEDDSGTHFVPPPQPLPRQQQAEDYAFAPSLQSISSSCSSRRNTYDGEELEEERVLPTPSSRIGSVPWTTTTASGPRVEHSPRFAAGFSRDGKEDMSTTVGGLASDKMSSALLSATCGFPGQPVVEASVGNWLVSFSRVVGRGGGSDGGGASTVVPGGEPGRETCVASAGDDYGGFAETLTTTATVSVSTVRVIDLLQRVPCHGVYRELLVIPSNRAPSPQQQQQQPGAPFSATLPVAAKPVRTSSEGRPASPTWQEWLEEEEDKGRHVARSGSPPVCGRDKTSHSGQEEPSMPAPARSGECPAPMGQQQRSQSPPPPQAPDDENPAPSVLVSYRKVVSFGHGEDAAIAVASGSPRRDTLGVGAENPVAEEASSGEHCRVSVAVELGGPVTANWNPCTLVALWGVRSALLRSAAGVGGDPDVDGVTPAEEPDPGGGDRDLGKAAGAGQETGSRSGTGASPTPTCSTEIEVAARRGLEVMFNKEKEGRQLIALSAASLALTVEASSGGCATDKSTVVWDGRLDDLTARDPRASNLLYSTLVGRPSPPRPTAQQPESPVSLTFRYSKEKGDESGEGPYVAYRIPPAALLQGATAPAEGRVAGPWESSSLSLSFSELQVVYFQPLWLEVIDFLWEGVLGAAVWGGSAVPEEEAEQGAPAATDGSTPADRRTPGAREQERAAADGGDPGLRSLSQIQVTLSAPTVVLPGSLTDPRHLALRPKTFRFSTWTGGADDSSAPPRLEECSPGGPVARHMAVEAGETDIGLGFCYPRGPRPQSPVGAVQHRATGLFYSLLQEPIDVKVAVKTVSPPPPSDGATGIAGSDCDDRDPPREVGRSSSSSSGGTGTTPAVQVGLTSGGAKVVEEKTSGDEGCNSDGTEGDGGAGSGEEGEQEKTMEVRVELPRLLQVSLTPDARAALAGCLGANILAAGFHGEVSENFPLVASKDDDDAATSIFGGADAAGVEQEMDEIDPEREVRGTTRGGGEKRHHERGGTEPRVDRAGGEVGGYPLPYSPRAVRKHQRRHPSPPQSPSGTAVGSRGGDGVSPPLACPLCTDSFDELLARHECAWCGGTVCRKCLHTQVLIYDDDGTSNAPGGNTGEGDAPIVLPSLICDNCAARVFPETSVSPAGQVRYRYGDDGPVTAVDVALEIPRIQVDFLPSSASLPWGAGEEEEDSNEGFPAGHRSRGTGHPTPGGMSVLGDGLELTYRRSARRMGGLEGSVGAVLLLDLSPGTAFSRIVSPAPVPVSGEMRPPQVVISYHFSPKTEAQVQVMVNHLETIAVPSAIHKLHVLAKPTPPPPTPMYGWKPGDERDPSPVGPPHSSGLGTPGEGVGTERNVKETRAATGGLGAAAEAECMHDLAALQLTQQGGEDGAPKTPLTLKATLLNPVLILPQDDKDPDCNALFLQGLIIANYVRSPRNDTAFQQHSNSARGAAAEARDTSLEIIRLESQVGRMFGGSGRAPGASTPSGLGAGAGAIDPVTLSLHYSEVERPLHPMVKDLKCQVEEVECQLTYQDMSLFNAVLSGWSSGLLVQTVDETADAGTGDTASAAVAADAAADAAVSPLSAAATSAFVRNSSSKNGFEDVDAPRLGIGMPPQHANDSADAAAAAAGAAAAALMGASALDLEDEEQEYEGEEGGEQIQDGRFYEVVFETAQLGIVLLRQDGVAVVEEVSSYNGVGGRAAGPFPGDELTEVAGMPTSCLSYDGVVDRIRASPRPISLRFRRALFKSWWGREYTLDLSYWDGHRLDGILLVGGGAGDQAVVGSVDGFRPRKRRLKGVPTLRPRAGALVVSVAGIPVSHLTVSAVTSLLNDIASEPPRRSPPARGNAGGERKKVAGGWTETVLANSSSTTRGSSAAAAAAAAAPGRGGGPQGQQRPRRQQHQLLPRDGSRSRSRSSRGRGDVIRLVLREVEVHAWPPNWRHEVQCPGVRVTVIDDLEGRDMPLLRAEVGSLDMTHESGPGMARHSAGDKRASLGKSILATTAGGTSAAGGGRTAGGVDTALLVVPVSRTAAACDAQVDYYNATGGRWEPLLERVVAQGDRAIVTRRRVAAQDPNTVTGVVGGGQGEEGEGEGESCSVVRLSCFEEDVKINVTHAALDVVLRALRDYKHLSGASSSSSSSSISGMGAGTGDGRPRVDGSGGSVKGAGPSSSPTSRSDGGAGGAVETTLAAAAQPQPQPQRYSPFLLQNRTGLKLEFWAHQDKVDSVSRFGKRGTVVGGMSDQPFSTSSTTEGQSQQPGRRNRRHASWLLSVRLVTAQSPSDVQQTGADDPPGVSGVGGDDDEGQRFLNLPLTEAGRSFLQCLLVMEGVPGREAAGDRGQSPRRLSRCDAIWEVCLENGRHTVTLRSALEVVNKCGSWLEVRCSTDSFAAGRGDGDKAKEEVVGAVAPGGRLPLPLRWSRAEDIRLRPWPRSQGGGFGDGRRSSSPSNNSMPKKVVEVHHLAGESGDQGERSYEYSDCSVLVPAARAGEGELGATTAVIPWVACNPSQPSTNSPADGDTTACRKPLFLFLEGLDANDPEGGGHGAAIPGGGSRRKASSDPWSKTRRTSRDGGGRSNSRVVANATLHGRQRQRPDASFPTRVVDSPRSAGNPMAALSLRPLEVVVYASLSFRNLLPVGVGWRVAGARGDAGARLAEGWLTPGDGVHVLEANAMAMAPSLSFKVAGFDWTPPHQVAVAELMRPTRAGSTDSDGGGSSSSSSSSRGREPPGGGVPTTSEHVPGISLQSVPCRNMSNQILYLSVEAASVRMNSVLVTVFSGFWVRNLSGLPLTLGEPVSRGLSPLELHEERLADSAARDKMRRYSPSPPRQSSWDVHLSAVQSDQHGMTEEVFELRLARRGQEGMDSYDTRWITAQGNPRSPCTQVRLPSDLWRWDGEWTMDVSGAVAPNAPGTGGGGWESCPRKLKGASYSNSSFSSSRAFTLSDPVWRRRWVRRRVPYRLTPQTSPAEGNEETRVSPSTIAGKPVGEGTSIIYQPSAGVVSKIGVPTAETPRAVRGGAGRASRPGAGLCVRVDDSAWSRPLNIAVQGAGGPFQVPGGRWPGLKRPAHPVANAAELRKSIEQRGRLLSPTASSGGPRGKRGVWGEGDVGVYELAYDVRVAPAPWNRTRVITVAARYTVMNKCDCVLVVRQYGSNVTMELGPGESRPLHWADGSLEATLSVSVISRGTTAAAAGSSPEMSPTTAALMDWSGPVGIGNIGTFPICIRPKPGGAALPVDSHVATPPESRASSPSSRAGSSGWSTPVSSPHRGGVEPMPMVGANRVLGVEVNIGRHSDGGGDGSERPVDGKDGPSGGGQGFRSSAVQVIFQEEAWGTGDRFPTYRLENHTNSRIFYGQASVPGPGDALPPGRSCLFGWDHPCPVEERVQGVLNLSLVLAAEPLSSPEGKRQAKTLNIRKLGERTSLVTSRGRVEVVVEPDGPSKLVRMYKSKAFSIMSPPTRTRARPPQPVQSTVERARTSPRAHSASAGGGNSGAEIVGPPRPLRRSVDLRGKKRTANAEEETSASLKRANSSPTPSPGVEGIAAAGALGIAAPRRQTGRNPRHRSLPPRGVSKNASAGGGDGASPSPVQEGGDSASSEEISLRELHVFCRAVRVSVVDGDRGEVVLGSLEGMSMNVAATEAEVEVKFKLGSLQIDNHLPGTSFPVLLQPVRPGYQGGDNKCVRFTLVAAPRVKNVAYIKLASLNVEEFDLRLDEGMVRWAQGLADRVMWTLVADRRADEMDKWPLPQEAFCSSQAGHPGGGKASGENIDGSSVGGGQGSTGMVVSRGGGEGAFASRYVYLEVFQVSSVKVRLSLQRAKDSFDNVYVGVKPGQMLLDLMMRMDSAHIKLKSLIVHNTTTTRSRLTLTAREHYERELKQQAFLMLGSLEAFGNPVGLVRGMGQGMQDFVKEPVLGLLKSVEDLAPEELMHGMARGAGSLLNHSVGGVANSVSLITGTVSQNLTTLAMDKEYKLKRARRKDARGENKDVLDGIGSAGGSLARGLTDGVSGLIKNPLKGAESGGLAGFAKGVGTGMLGLVVKPVVGVTDAATDLLQGVRGTTASIAQIGKPSPSASPYHQTAGPPSAGHGRGGSLGAAGDGGGAIGGGGAGGWDEGVGQVRPRRVLYGSMRTLRPYAIEDARAAALLRTTRYKEEEYAAHLEISQAAGAGATSKPTSAVVILTQSLVLLLRVPGGEVVLEQRLAGIQAVEIKAEGVLLHLHPPSTPKAPRQGASGYLGLPPPPSEEDDGPGGGRNRGRVQARGIPCREEASKRRLYDLLDAAVKNAARAL